jgi:hypothetical protein
MAGAEVFVDNITTTWHDADQMWFRPNGADPRLKSAHRVKLGLSIRRVPGKEPRETVKESLDRLVASERIKFYRLNLTGNSAEVFLQPGADVMQAIRKHGDDIRLIKDLCDDLRKLLDTIGNSK